MNISDITLYGVAFGFLSGFVAFFLGYAISKSLQIFNL